MLKRGSPLWIGLLALPWVLGGLWIAFGSAPSPPQREVIVYCALDRLYAQPILDRFTERTGITVRAKWDTEASKTTGLVKALLTEHERPRCDVFWNNEVSQTIRLADAGALDSYRSPSAVGIPDWARDPKDRWTGFAARARVLIVNEARVPKDARPTSVQDLADPRWRGQVGIAKPLFGTTATHAAVLFALNGPEPAIAFFESLKANRVVICAGNADVKDRVVAGELAFGWTDTDDAHLAMLAGEKIVVVFPDQGPEGKGTLLIPNSVAVIQGGPNPVEARALVDALLSAETEEALAAARSAQIPLRPGLERPSWIPKDLKALNVDWQAAGQAFGAARTYLDTRFLAPAEGK
ncbi:MAG: extracellular solute-binding protein [Planctomycetes bacterium]|nr:extracellular solute-binding protein [Planctomycetota bacterium]